VVVEEPEQYEKWKNAQEAWLKQNPDYMKFVPENYKEMAAVKSGISGPVASAVNQ